MLPHLDRKLWRDLRRMAGQAIAVALVMACGLAMMVMARSLIFSLESTRQEYYEANRFAQVFAHLKRAPNSLAARASQIPGVAAVQAAISMQVTLDIPGLDEPASGDVRSLPDLGQPVLNRLFLRRGHWLVPGQRGEVLVVPRPPRGRVPAEHGVPDRPLPPDVAVPVHRVAPSHPLLSGRRKNPSEAAGSGQ